MTYEIESGSITIDRLDDGRAEVTFRVDVGEDVYDHYVDFYCAKDGTRWARSNYEWCGFVLCDFEVESITRQVSLRFDTNDDPKIFSEYYNLYLPVITDLIK